MKKNFLTFLIMFFSFVMGFSQEPNDLENATAVCGDIDFAYTPTGPGADDFASNPNPTCLPSDPVESQSIWLQLTIDTGGILEFSLIPNNGADDYDWAIFDITTAAPNTTGTQLRCSSTMFLPPIGRTGLVIGATDLSEGPGSGDGFLAPLNVNAGDVYLLFINNWSSSTSGFNLSFGGTATFNPPPTDEVPVGVSIDIEECDTDGVPDHATVFDLTVNTPIIIGSQTGVVVTYHTTEGEAQIGANAILSPAIFQSVSQTIYARITNIGTECFSVVNFDVIVTATLAMITTNIDIEQCDDNNDGLWNFDLTQNDVEIIDGQPNMQVTYHESEAEANLDSNPIVGLYQNTSNPQIIWTRLENISGCYGTLSFQIQVFDTPIANAPPTMILCDDDNNGTMPFDLTVQDSFINTAAGITITYHATQTDANTNTSPISSPFESGNTTIFARVENDLNTDCYDTTSFDVEVYDSAFPSDSASMMPLDLCDDTSFGTIDDGIIITDLTVKSTELLNGQSVTDFDLTYFTDAAYTGLITTPNAFTNTTAGGQTIYVRMTNNLNAICFGDTSFELQIFEQPTATEPSIMILCDDDNNGTMPFDLTQQDSFINSDVGMTITYHATQTDADTNTSPISSPFESGNATIFARVENDLNTDCYDTTSFDVEVYDSAFPLDTASILPIQECDNTTFGTDIDGFIVFDLTQRETAILNGQSATDFTLTYFEDAGYSLQVITPATFLNTTSGGQQIFVRITNNLNATCFADVSFEIEVFELPVLNAAPFVLEQCDDDFDGFNIFNLTEINTDIVTNITSEVFTYYETQADALSGNSPITNSITYLNQIVNVDNSLWVRIENGNGCFRVTQVELIVKPSAIPVGFLREFFECDAGDDTTDGISTFDFSSVTAEIEAIFPIAIDVFYYENEADATSEINEIPDPSNFTNTNSPNTQEIWVRADSALGNDCLGNGHHITLTVHPLPQFEVEPTAIVCLNLPPITLETFNANGVYTYVWTDEDNAVISTDPTASVSSGGEYSVVASYVTSSGASCQSEPRFVTVSESIIASFTLDDITITDDSDNNTITVNTSNLGIGDYEFTLDAIDGIYQDEPFFDRVAPGLHTIFIRDKNDCGVVDLEIAVIGFPKFFTPNNDGENDFWRVKGVTANYFSTSLITIYDRFGKAIARVDPTGDGWDGFYNGEQLPATDYWFTAELIDQEGNIRNRKGHFSLIRR